MYNIVYIAKGGANLDNVGQALAKFSQIALYMVVPIIICMFLGKWIDEKLGTNAVFLIIFIILGVLASFRNLYIYVMKPYAEEQKKEEEDLKRFKYNDKDKD